MTKKISPEQLKIIRETQATLLEISQGNKVFFNIAQYKALGLTYSTKVWYTSARGTREVLEHKHHLTNKGQQILNVVL